VPEVIYEDLTKEELISLLREDNRSQSRLEERVVLDVILGRVDALSKRVDEAEKLHQELTQRLETFFDGMQPSSFAPDGRPKYRLSRKQHNEWIELGEAKKRAYSDFVNAIAALSEVIPEDSDSDKW
jgi:predicted phage gp36 major capsid-like protein